MNEFEITDGVLEKFHGEGGEVVIPAGVRAIGFSAFEGCTGLTSVVIPEGVTEIGKDAFRGCCNLTSVTLPRSMETIAYKAFRGCGALNSVTIRDIHFDSEAIAYLAERWKVEAFRIFDVLYNHAAIFVSLATYTYPVTWVAFRLCPEDEKNTFYLQSHIVTFLLFFLKEDEQEIFRELLGNALFHGGIQADLKKLLSSLIEMGQEEAFREILESGASADGIPDYIDDLIEQAIARQQHGIQLLLTNYKREKIGFTNVKKQFEL